MTSRFKKLFTSPPAPEANGGTETKKKKVSSRTKSASPGNEYAVNDGTVQQAQSKPSRSPFSIRRVKPVKPEKLTMNNNNGNSTTIDSVKKRTSFLRRKSTDPMTDRKISVTSESRMVIRRNRSPGATRLNSIGSMNEIRSPTYDRYSKKFSLPTRPFSGITTGSVDYDPEDIERRRRRIRSISNSVPPLPVSSRYRGYLSRSEPNRQDTSGSNRFDFRNSVFLDNSHSNIRSYDIDISTKTETENLTKTNTDNNAKTSTGDLTIINTEMTTEGVISNSNNIHRRPVLKFLDLDDESGRSDNEKSNYASTSDRRTLFRTSKSDKVFNSPKVKKAAKGRTADDSRVNGNTKFPEAAIVQQAEEENDLEDRLEDNKNDSAPFSKNIFNYSLNFSDRSDIDDSDMENNGVGYKTKRSASLREPKTTSILERKSSHPDNVCKSNEGDEPSPDPVGTPRMPNNTMGRLKRDYHLTETEITALRGIMKKADMYDQTVRERLFQVLKIEKDTEGSLEEIVAKVVCDKEIETLKQRLFMSRKELDSYISFTKKMEREKRQFQSEKEELETKIQWHERRLSRFETENKSLKTERANMMNQIYELRSKSSSINKEGAHNRQKSMDVSQALTEQSKLESSKQRFIHEADVFAQERTKLIKERQRLDEDNRKAHIRNVSLIAQVQHWEKTVKELEIEKEELKNRLGKMSRQSVDDQRKLIHQSSKDLTDSGLDVSDKDHNYNCLIETIKFDDSEITRLRKELEDLEGKFENLKNDYRNIEENQITIDHENMALKDTVNVLQNAKEEADSRLNEVDKKYHETLTELKTTTLSSEELEKDHLLLQKEFEHVSASLSELQRDAVEMESDQDSFKKFLDKLSMELQEKLGEEHVSKDTEAESLQEQAEIIGRQVVAHLNPSRKLQEDYEALKIDKDDLEEEIKFLKFALSNRMEIKTLQAPAQKCDCSREKAALKRDYEDALNRLEALEDEVTRLHQDKQQLLMSFLNLQASTRSRDVSKSGIATDDDDMSDEETETERESDYDTDIASRSIATSSNAGSLSDIKIEDDDDRNSDSSGLKSTPALAISALRPRHETEDDLKVKMEEAMKTIQRLESERIEMLDSLCQQADNNNTLKNELEDLKNGFGELPGSRSGSRTSSCIVKSESMASITSEKCMNCQSSSNEIRSYLSIIEELTEDKLRLEKSVNDLELEKEKYENDLEKMTENYIKMESEMVMVGTEKESTVQNAKEETILLLRNVQSLREENTLLEENLQQLDEDRREVLQNLKQAEEDRLGFIRTLQLISEQKETVEDQLEKLQVENEDLKERLKELEGSVSTFTPLDLSKGIENEGADGYEVDDPSENKATIASAEDEAKLPVDDNRFQLGRFYSTPIQTNSPPQVERTFSTALQSPQDFPIRRTSLKDDINEGDITELVDQISSLKKEVNTYRELNTELNNSLDYANSLLREEKKWNLRMSPERSLSPVSSPCTSDQKPLADESLFQDETSTLETISETSAAGEKPGIAEPRRLSLERRRIEESKNFDRQLSDENGTMKPPLERRNSIVEEETKRRPRLYGTRKPSMSLDEMFDLFGVQSTLPSPSSGGPSTVDEESTSPSFGPQSSAKTMKFDVFKNGIPIQPQKEF